jgi:hypothetical protein
MAARKVKSSVNGRARKKSAKPSVRGGAKGKTSPKRTRRASRSKPKASSAVKSPRAPRRTETAVAPVADRKPVKKAEPRPQRPPAVLPIPQSTFFF